VQGDSPASDGRSAQRPSVALKLRALLLATFQSLLVASVGSLVLGALLAANAATGLSVPWSAAVIVVYLVVYWRWLGGTWPPTDTSAARRDLLRARRVPVETMARAFVAGLIGLGALAGLWISCVELFGGGGNPTVSSLLGYPAYVVAIAYVMGSLNAPVTEEAAFRGYAQTRVERAFPPVVAVILSSVLFALFHAPTQGFIAWKLLFFFLVGALFGTIAHRTKSTIPALPVHFTGDMLFFFVIWPADASRSFAPSAGADLPLVLSAVAAVVLAPLAAFALRSLRS